MSPPDDSAGARHVPWRPFAQAEPGGVWLSPASPLDNRPLTFEEFENRVNQAIYVSATPGPYELTKTGGVVVEQVIRPTGCDRSAGRSPSGARPDRQSASGDPLASGEERSVSVTTLTKRMAEDLAEYYTEVGVRCRYLHSEIDTLERIKILRGLRKGEFDVLIGINLLREGAGSSRGLAGRNSRCRQRRVLLFPAGCVDPDHGPGWGRHLNGRAILYADKDDRFDEACHRRDGSPPRYPDALTTRSTASRRSRSCGRSTCRWLPSPMPIMLT